MAWSSEILQTETSLTYASWTTPCPAQACRHWFSPVIPVPQVATFRSAPSPSGDKPPRPREDDPPAEEFGASKAGQVTSEAAPDSRDHDKRDRESPRRSSASPASPDSGLIEADDYQENVDDDVYPESTNTSYLTSIASDIRRGIQENGRTYGVYGIHKAWIPSDDLEASSG
ncbi:hypothetical protein NM208_g7655 [Fusarium decemcellulare]|uniref:Uncharacterized protein n=1 Tax=Fusarium decemcellulare TaxID=57161 RepID=A0ACC1S8J0_9HYPO|nr:hypothetical protein NM208_g7655 [Fusarium decemcellulare]